MRCENDPKTRNYTDVVLNDTIFTFRVARFRGRILKEVLFSLKLCVHEKTRTSKPTIRKEIYGSQQHSNAKSPLSSPECATERPQTSPVIDIR